MFRTLRLVQIWSTCNPSVSSVVVCDPNRPPWIRQLTQTPSRPHLSRAMTGSVILLYCLQFMYGGARAELLSDGKDVVVLHARQGFILSIESLTSH